MEIRQFIWSVVDSNSFLLTEGNGGLLIDAVDDPDLLEAVAPLESLTVVLTHAHFDHIIGLNRIRAARPDATVVATARCSGNLGNIYRNMSSSATAFMTFYDGSGREIEPFTCAPAELAFEEEYGFDWRGHRVELKAVFGHSNDSLIAVLDGKLLFSGDTLLNIPTVTRFPTGNTRMFWDHDVPALRGMSGVERVYPGHGEPGGLEDMLAVNQMPSRRAE